MSIKLIAVDIDGTLVNSKKKLLQKFLQLFKMPKQLESRLSLQQDAPSLVLPNSLMTCS